MKVKKAVSGGGPVSAADVCLALYDSKHAISTPLLCSNVLSMKGWYGNCKCKFAMLAVWQGSAAGAPRC